MINTTCTGKAVLECRHKNTEFIVTRITPAGHVHFFKCKDCGHIAKIF